MNRAARELPCFRVVGAPDVRSPRTYVIFGVPRGGTSMVGGLARLCGLPLGADLPNNHEDPDFNYDFIRRDGHEPIPHMVESIERRNAEHTTWGWKYPRAAQYLDEIRPRLRNPHLIVVLRDPVASAGRHVFRGKDPMDTVLDHHEIQARNFDLVSRWQVPTLLVSYERGSARPVMLARHLADFLGFPAPTDRQQIRGFVQPGTYQQVP